MRHAPWKGRGGFRVAVSLKLKFKEKVHFVGIVITFFFTLQLKSPDN
jgi:hypothetical protein